MNNFYVYGLFHPITHSIFYVGLSHRDDKKEAFHSRYRRPFHHFKYFNRLLNNRKYGGAKIHVHNEHLFNVFVRLKIKELSPIIKIIKDDLTYDEAYELEVSTIRSLGRMVDKSGILTNIVIEAQKSPVYCKEVIEKIKKTRRKTLDSDRGIEIRRAISESAKRRLSNLENRPFGEKNPMFGKEPSEKTKKQISNSLKEFYHDNEEARNNISKQNLKNWEEWKKNGRAEIIIKKRSLKKRRRIICFNVDLSIIKVFNSYLEAGESMNLLKSNISAASRKISTNCGGFIWRKFDQELLKILVKRKINKHPIECRSYKRGEQIIIELYEDI